ncbi:S8 family peptidase [Tindallia californiensis]|uniref:Subtilase family protein n=1 Tax=Tindallia californiensis TaxID=159292 RepID=A0A1H3RD19_9FIRM|nr:S8 family peptidase [Tindallia californiensis]SDZ23546.1 Subtilase family protein [Tindallia californiensis]
MKHIEFSKVRLEDRERRKRRGFGDAPPSKDHTTHAAFLDESLDSKVQEALEKSQRFEFHPYLVMKIELEPGYTLQDSDEEKLEYFGVKIIDKETKELQVLFTDDLRLENFKIALENYKQGKIAKTKIENQDLFSIIKSITEWSREDRLGLDISSIKDGDYIDCYLWVFDTVDKSNEKMNEFKNFVANNNGRVCDIYVGDSVVLSRVKLGEGVLDKILEHPLVYKVESIPKFNILHNMIKTTKEITLDQITFDTSRLFPEESSSICIIDSGIFMQHPLLRGVIGDSKTFYCSDEYQSSTNDFDGHGTKVASICEYGDFSEKDEFTPEIFLFNAKIHDGQYTNTFELWKREVTEQIGEFSWEITDIIMAYEDGEITFEDLVSNFPQEQQPYLKMVYSRYSAFYEKLIPNQMKEIVEYFYKGYGCRIYNLSQGSIDYIYDGLKPKAWACVLDELQNLYDIVFVISSGNYLYEANNDYNNIFCRYPLYFYQSPECRVIEPANSATSITVGSMAISDEVYNVPERLERLNITSRDNLSSITRVGPGVMNAVKPEFVAYGGDRSVFVDPMGNHRPVPNLGLSKLLFNNDNAGMFEWDVGTSFAAPYISHILGCFLNRYPQASNNLMRAIIASSAKIPVSIRNQVQEIIDSEEELQKEFLYQNKSNYNKLLYYTAGYGYPDKYSCLSSLDNRVVLMADINTDEEAIKPDNMHIFEIPLPKEFRQSSGKKKVIISLAFNPQVRNTRLDYIGISMDYKLVKGKTKEEVIEIFETQKGKEDAIPIENRCVCDLEPSTTIRSNGTLQKSTFEFSRDTNFDNDNLYLVVNAKKNWSEKPQKYAVVAVLESEDKDLKIYNEIKSRVEGTITTRIRV